MRTRLSQLEVLGAATRLPATGERVAVPFGPAGPRDRSGLLELPAFEVDPRSHPDLPGHLRKRIDRFSAVAYLAIAAVLAELGAAARPERDRIGVFLANTKAGWSYGEPELGLLVDEGPAAMHAYQATAWFPAAAQGEATIALDLRGCAKTSAGRVSGFGEALWLARDALERGAVDLAVVGAVESLVNGFVLGEWAHAPLPGGGPAEGAVVFALRRPAGSGVAQLSDLRHAGAADEPPGEPGDTWVPTLSAAERLHAALTPAAHPPVGVTQAGPPTDRQIAVPLGGGYWITVNRPEPPAVKESP